MRETVEQWKLSSDSSLKNGRADIVKVQLFIKTSSRQQVNDVH